MSAASSSAVDRVPSGSADGVLARLGIDGCVRLPIAIDAAAVAGELARLPPGCWRGADRDPVVQAAVESFFAIGFPRGPTPKPADDREPLVRLPVLRRFLRETVPARPTRAIVARLEPGGLIPAHCDTPRFFRDTLRLSIQIAGGAQRLLCGGLWYDLHDGDAWAIDNLRLHAVCNATDQPRVNVLVDYVPSEGLIRLLRDGEVGLGRVDDSAHREIEARSRDHYRRNRWRSLRYELFKLVWRRR